MRIRIDRWDHGPGDNRTAGETRRAEQGIGGIPRRCRRRCQAGERLGVEDEGADRSARRTVAADARRNRTMNDLHWMTLVDGAGAIAARKLSPVELMSALLERIGRLDPKLNVFIRLEAEAAMEEAR